MPVGFGDVLVAAGFDRDDAVPVGAVGGGLDGISDCHAYTVVATAVVPQPEPRNRYLRQGCRVAVRGINSVRESGRRESFGNGRG